MDCPKGLSHPKLCAGIKYNNSINWQEELMLAKRHLHWRRNQHSASFSCFVGCSSGTMSSWLLQWLDPLTMSWIVPNPQLWAWYAEKPQRGATEVPAAVPSTAAGVPDAPICDQSDSVSHLSADWTQALEIWSEMGICYIILYFIYIHIYVYVTVYNIYVTVYMSQPFRHLWSVFHHPSKCPKSWTLTWLPKIFRPGCDRPGINQACSAWISIELRIRKSAEHVLKRDHIRSPSRWSLEILNSCIVYIWVNYIMFLSPEMFDHLRMIPPNHHSRFRLQRGHDWDGEPGEVLGLLFLARVHLAM